jgi:hypothetical protein
VHEAANEDGSGGNIDCSIQNHVFIYFICYSLVVSWLETVKEQTGEQSDVEGSVWSGKFLNADHISFLLNRTISFCFWECKPCFLLRCIFV